jgi:hypothetical protein
VIDKESMKLAIKEVFDEEIKPFYIDREQHFKDHEKTQSIDYKDIAFITEARKFVEALKDTFWKTFVRTIFVFLFTACTGGFFLWLKYHDK